jgi:ankyrin repeat protein
MLQCLVVAIRPLLVEELAELLAFEFDATQGGIPKYRAAWRLDDRTQAVLSTCSSLVTIVNDRQYGQIVQFSHFSVKEFLTSDRLISSLGDVSRYHIRLEFAHTVLTQACLGILLHLDEHINNESVKGFPLAGYAARHWFEHAQFEDVASQVKDGMGMLFDPDKPHFAAWVRIYDIDTPKVYERDFSASEISPNLTPNPLYYAVLCGFYDLVDHLALKNPQHVHAICGRYSFPLLAALGEGHVEVAERLLEHGADVDARETTGKTVLLKALSRPQPNLLNMVEFLLYHGADVNARDNALRSSLHYLVKYGGDLEVAQILVRHGAVIDPQDDSGKTPLHTLSERRIPKEGDVLDHALLLLQLGADANSQDKDNQTPLHLAIGNGRFKLAQILLEHGADPNVENNDGKTPLHILSERQINDKTDGDVLNNEILAQGAENRRFKDNEPPLLPETGTGMCEFGGIYRD